MTDVMQLPSLWPCVQLTIRAAFKRKKVMRRKSEGASWLLRHTARDRGARQGKLDAR